MNFKVIVIIAIVYLYGLLEFYINYRQKKKANEQKIEDKGSLWIITASIGLGYLLSFIIASTKTGRIYHWNLLFAAGLMIFAIGLIIRVTSIRMLNEYFTYSVAKVENHELIEKGFYKHVRHPGYLGQIIIFFGVSIALSNWIAVFAMLIPVLIGYTYRIKVEEKFMVEQFGDKYVNYQTRTKKLIPKLY